MSCKIWAFGYSLYCTKPSAVPQLGRLIQHIASIGDTSSHIHLYWTLYFVDTLYNAMSLCLQQEYMSITAILAAISAVLIGLYLWQISDRHLYPPGPLPLPLVGWAHRLLMTNNPSLDVHGKFTCRPNSKHRTNWVFSVMVPCYAGEKGKDLRSSLKFRITSEALGQLYTLSSPILLWMWPGERFK